MADCCCSVKSSLSLALFCWLVSNLQSVLETCVSLLSLSTLHWLHASVSSFVLGLGLTVEAAADCLSLPAATDQVKIEIR